jgi:hypothetical protein
LPAGLLLWSVAVVDVGSFAGWAEKVEHLQNEERSAEMDAYSKDAHHTLGPGAGRACTKCVISPISRDGQLQSEAIPSQLAVVGLWFVFRLGLKYSIPVSLLWGWPAPGGPEQGFQALFGSPRLLVSL